MRLKSHESPRHRGRNDRGRGGTARKKQLDKRNRALLQKLKDQSKDNTLGQDPESSHSQNPNSNPSAGPAPAFFWAVA